MRSKRITISALACGAASVVIVGSGVAANASSPGHDDTSHPRTLHLLQHQLGIVFVPVPGQDPNVRGPGTQLIGNYELFAGKKMVGRADIGCILDSEAQALCTAVNQLQGGQISVAALVPLSNPFNNTSPITGGTGRYRGASGQVTSTPVSDVDSNLVFQFDD
jgi:hypothetical protein